MQVAGPCWTGSRRRIKQALPWTESVILCVILFLPVTYSMTAVPGMMFLLGIYCTGGYGGSMSAILSVYCIIFLILIAAAVGTIVRGKVLERRAAAKKED